MNKNDIEKNCRRFANELLDEYFPNFAHEAAVERPEKLAIQYNDSLPHRIGEEFRIHLYDLWIQHRPLGGKPFDEVMNLERSIKMVDASYVSYLKDARENAEKITFWELITKSNHKDVTYYKGLLKQYTEELLDVMLKDFMGDIQEKTEKED